MENILVTPALPTSRALVWTGRVLTGLVVAFLLFDGIGKLVPLAPFVEGTRQLGYAVDVVRPLGLVLVLATIVHVVPRTQVLGALVLTAYLGGATATLVRVGAPCWFPIAMGIVLWAALFMRSARLRSLVFA